LRAMVTRSIVASRTSGKTKKTAPGKSPKEKLVGVVYGEGCDTHCVRNTCLLLAQGGFQLKLVEISQVGKPGSLDGLDILVVGGGDDDDNRKDTREGRPDSDNHYGRGQRRALGKKGMRAIYQKVKMGLMYVGICAGAYLASAKQVHHGCDKGAENLRLCEVNIHKEEVFAGGVTGAVELLANSELDSRLRRVLRRAPQMRFDDSAVLSILDKERVQVLATYKRPVARGTLSLTVPRNAHGRLAYKGVHRYLSHEQDMVGRPAVVMSQLEQGKVLLFGPHPELHSMVPSKLPDRSARSVLKDLILHVANHSEAAPSVQAN